MILVTAVLPLFRASQLHFPLAQRLVIDLFQIFLDDEICIEAFDRFIMQGRPKVSQYGRESAYEHRKSYLTLKLNHIEEEIELFRAFMALRQHIILRDDHPRNINRLVKEFIQNDKIARLFPVEYVDEIAKLYQEDPSSVTLRHFDKLHGFAICYFQ